MTDPSFSRSVLAAVSSTLYDGMDWLQSAAERKQEIVASLSFRHARAEALRSQFNRPVTLADLPPATQSYLSSLVQSLPSLRFLTVIFNRPWPANFDLIKMEIDLMTAGDLSSFSSRDSTDVGSLLMDWWESDPSGFADAIPFPPARMIPSALWSIFRFIIKPTRMWRPYLPPSA